jgi:Ran GTPase-activating protein (RanGAP) involved in mRNA processing and transport
MKTAAVSTVDFKQLAGRYFSLFTFTQWTSTLKELNFSGNRLDREGTFVLSDWITCAFALERLYLANTHLETGIFFKALKQNSILHESSLGLLDISYNSFTSTASEDFGKILAKTQSLSVLVLRGMKLSKKHLDDIFEPLFQNSIRTFPCSVDLSENDLSGKKARILATLLENSPCATRECLSLDNCNLKDESVR